MGRKSREKRERRKNQLPDEVLEMAPGVTLSRKGHIVQVENHRTQEEQDEYLNHLNSLKDKLPSEIDLNIKKARILLRKLPISVTLSLIAFESFTTDPEEYEEHEVTIPAAVVEYATWLALTDTEPKKLSTKWEPFNTATYKTLKDTLIAIISATTTLWALQAMKEDHSKKHEILSRAKIDSLIVRQPAYPKHQKDILLRLFTPFSEHTKKAIGLSITEIVKFTEALLALTNERINNRFAESNSILNKFKGALKSSQKAKALSPEDKDVLAKIKSSRNPESALKSLLAMWLDNTTDLAFKLTPQELAEFAGTDEATAQCFLETFSTSFNQAPAGSSESDRPSLYEPLEKAPIIKLSSNQWLAHLAAPKLLAALQPALEGILKKTKHWHQYERSRGAILEERAIDLIASLSAHTKKYRKLYYRFDDGEGLKRFELDGMIIIDNVAFIVEAKSGVVRLPGRRGAPSVIEDIKKLVGEAHAQALRTIRYINSAATASFEDEDGSLVVEIRHGEMSRFFPIAVTLDHLTAFVTRASDLVSLGVVSDGVLPWAVYLNDLHVIVEQVEGIGQFVHYIERRLDIERTNVTTHDELDWFCFYIEKGLYFEEQSFASRIHIMDHTDALSAYYLYEEGLRKTPVEKPRQVMAPEIRKLMLELEQTGVPGFIEAIFSLLNGDHETRSELGKSITLVQEHARAKGSYFLRILFPDRVFIYVAYTGSAKPTITKTYVDASKYQAQKDLAVAVCQSLDNNVQTEVLVAKDRWHYDSLLEKSSFEFFGSIMSTNILLNKKHK